MNLRKKIRKKLKPNKVTPLSKGIALVLFISMPFIGFCLGREYQKSIDQVKIQKLEIENAVLKNVEKRFKLLE